LGKLENSKNGNQETEIKKWNSKKWNSKKWNSKIWNSKYGKSLEGHLNITKILPNVN